MNSTVIAPTRPQPTSQPALTVARPAPVLASSENPSVAAAEESRWLRMLATPFVLSALCWGAAFGTQIRWFIAPAMVFGVGCLIYSMIYLSLTSDSNSE